MVNRYMIMSNVAPLLRRRHNSGQVFDECERNKIIWHHSLTDQHGKKRMFQGPVTITAYFALPFPIKASIATQEKMRDGFMTSFPSLGSLAKLLGELCEGILFNSDVIIVDMKLTKVFRDEPSVQFEVREIVSGGKND